MTIKQHEEIGKQIQKRQVIENILLIACYISVPVLMVLTVLFMAMFS